MSRGPATRPVEPGDAEALQSALTRAREQAAAPVPPPAVPEPDRPGKTPRVEETAPVVAGAVVQGGPRPARSFRLDPRRRKRAKEKTAAVPRDPRGRGGRVDVRV